MTGWADVPAALQSLSADDVRLRRLPNLFLIGASKSGSSALHAYLGSHPEVCASREKEPCFFVDRAELLEAWPVMARQACSRDWDAYLDLWRGGEYAKIRLEGSTLYSQAPYLSGVPARIASVFPQARFLYVVREPVSRAIAHYWQDFKEFRESLPIEDAVREHASYRNTSDYALQLRSYFQHFNRDQFKIIVSEDLRTKRRDVMSDLQSWIGLQHYDYSDGELRERHMSKSTSRRQRFPFVRHLRDSGAWSRIRHRLPGGVVDNLRNLATVNFEKKDVDETGARAYLSEYLAPRRAEFEALIGRRIEAWN